MNMRNMWLVARREFVSRGKSSAYRISTPFMLVAILMSTVAPEYMAQRAETQPLTVLLVDRTGQVAEPLAAALAEAAAATGAVPVTLSAAADEPAATEVAHAEGKAVLVVEGEFPGAVKARFLAGSRRILGDAGSVLGPLESVVRAARIRRAGIDPQIATELLRPLDATVAQVGVGGEQRDEAAYTRNFSVAFGIVFVLYMVLIINGQFLFQGVLEEKVSRVMEVMAASVGPSQMLAGKVMGLGALGLIQFAGIGAAWAAGTAYVGNGVSSQAFTPSTAVLVLLFLLLGHVVSATLMAAAAATISRLEDQQAALMPVIILIAVPFMMLASIMNDPGSTLATVLSLIPFSSQSIMVFRIMMSEVPFWQVAISLALMILTAVLTILAGGRVYRAAMLSYGGRPSLRQVWSYLRAG